MIKSTLSLTNVKTAIKRLRGRAVKVTVELGRNKRESFAGVLTGVYPALFTVSPADKEYRGKTSYSYSEYMCGKVKVCPKDSC